MSTLKSFSRSKRDQFEEQLRSLQSDISQLSSKLEIESPSTKNMDKNGSYHNMNVSNSIQYEEIDAAPPNLKGQIARMQKNLHELERERDEYKYRYEQVNIINTRERIYLGF